MHRVMQKLQDSNLVDYVFLLHGIWILISFTASWWQHCSDSLGEKHKKFLALSYLHCEVDIENSQKNSIQNIAILPDRKEVHKKPVHNNSPF